MLELQLTFHVMPIRKMCYGKMRAQSYTQRCGLRPSVLGQDRSETKKSVLVGLGLGLAVLVLFCKNTIL